FPAAAPIAAPAIKIAARSLGFLLGHAYAAEINAIVQAHNDDVTKLAQLLERDFAEMAKLLHSQAEDFQVHRKKNLSAVREKGNVDRLRLYTEFKTARGDVAAIISLATAAKKFSSVFHDLADTHDALANGEPDSEIALRNFIALMGDITELVKAAQ